MLFLLNTIVVKENKSFDKYESKFVQIFESWLPLFIEPLLKKFTVTNVHSFFIYGTDRNVYK